MIGRETVLRWVVAGIILIAVGAGGGYWWAQHRMASSSAEPGVPADAGGKKVLYWHDPMVPNVKFDKPGKSPFMDMQLVPVYADDEQGGVRVSAAAAQNLGIRLGRVERVAIHNQVRAVGSVAFDERLLELVQPRVEGYITRLHVKSTLERVRRGQPLAEILAPQWLEAEQEYLALLDATAERAQVLREAARQRLTVLGIPETTIRAVEKTRKASASTTVFAPIEGVVTELGAREGSTFMSGATLFRINGLSTVWVNAQVPEAKASMVTVGAQVEARATGWPGTMFEGGVIALLPQVDPQTRTLTARVSIDNQEQKLSPGMFVTLDFIAPEAAPQLVVPTEAIISTGERNVVIAARKAGGFDVVNVELGPEQEGQTVILSGLEEGRSVVLSGQFLIDSEASLKSTANRLEAGAASGAAMPGMSESAPADAMPSMDKQQAIHTTRGTVTEITADAITLSHEPVPSLNWPAMTMGFKLPTGGLPADIKVGDRVSFSFTQGKEGSFRIESIAHVDAMPEIPR